MDKEVQKIFNTCTKKLDALSKKYNVKYGAFSGIRLDDGKTNWVTSSSFSD